MRKIALSFLQDAKSCLEEAKRASIRGDYARAVSRSQECVEYVVKALFEALEFSYPFIHDVGPQLLLLTEDERLPEDLRRDLILVQTPIGHYTYDQIARAVHVFAGIKITGS